MEIPNNFIMTTLPSVIASTISIIDRIVATENGSSTTQLTSFIATRKPTISIEQYAKRIATKSGCSEACFVYAVVMAERLLRRGVIISPMNVHRLLLVMLMIAVKFLDDDYYNNEAFAKIGGISNE
jgi:Cyclin